MMLLRQMSSVRTHAAVEVDRGVSVVLRGA